MSDLFFLALMFGFFLIAFAYTRACERLGASRALRVPRSVTGGDHD